MNNRESTTELTFSTDIMEAKSLKVMLTAGRISPNEIVDECLNEVITGLNLNTHDIPFYIMALEILHTSLYTHIDKDGPGEELINQLRSRCKVITVPAVKFVDDDTDTSSTSDDEEGDNNG